MNRLQAVRGLHYPEVPALYVNRATRRAVKQGREFRLSAPWKAVLAGPLGQKTREFIKGL